MGGVDTGYLAVMLFYSISCSSYSISLFDLLRLTIMYEDQCFISAVHPLYRMFVAVYCIALSANTIKLAIVNLQVSTNLVPYSCLKPSVIYRTT
jgi:hypothetical protein